jgi:hypothetical protein
MKSSKRFIAHFFNVAAMVFSLVCLDASAQATLPLKGTMDFQAAMSETTDGTCPLVGMNHGAGKMAPLGIVIMAATECIMPDSPALKILNAYNGRLTLTASNGDTLNASYTGSFILSADGKTYTTSGVTFGITGGTDRFAGAKGRGELVGTQDAVSGVGKLTATGTISY